MAAASWPEGRSSIGDLVGRLLSEATGLLGDSLRLLTAEARERLSELAPVVMLLGAAAGSLMVSLLAAGAALVAALMNVMPLWGAALVVAALALAVAVGLWAVASKRLRESTRAPEQTLKALEEGMEWLRYRSQAQTTVR